MTSQTASSALALGTATSLKAPSPERGLLGPKWSEHDTFTVEEFGQIFGLSRTAAYAAVNNDDKPIGVIKIGRRIIIPRAAIERLLAGVAA